jgi:flagella basal body P-ring formation protein FlgA
MIAFGLLLALANAPSACHPVDSMRMLGRDLAAADSNFAKLAPDLSLGYAPSPGAQRIFKTTELARIARAHGLAVNTLNELCFEWPLSILEPEQMIGAMQQCPGLTEAQIEVVEFDRHPAPRGKMVFSPAGLVSATADSKSGVVWHGYIQYAPNQRFAIWARVRIAVTEKRIVANHPLRAGDTITADDLRTEDTLGFSFHSAAPVRIEDVVGQTTRRAIRAGDAILRSLLEPAKDIKKGDAVEVKVADDNLLFRVDGEAETAGRRGETILVRNISSGKKFQARVEAPGQVSVSPQAALKKGLPQ